jgi:hypothetical protein
MAFAISALRWLSLAAGTMQGMNTHISTWNLEGSAARSGRGSRSAYVWKTVALSVTANSLISWCDEVGPDQPVVIGSKVCSRHLTASGSLYGQAMSGPGLPLVIAMAPLAQLIRVPDPCPLAKLSGRQSAFA